MKASKRVRTGIKNVVNAAKQRLADDGIVFHMMAAVREIKLAYYTGKLAAWKDATAYLSREARYSVEVARAVEDIMKRMIGKVEKEVSRCE